MKQIITSGLLVLGLLTISLSTPTQAAIVPCTDGVATVGSGDSAVSYACLRVDLLSQMSITDLGGDTVDNNAVSDMWGWVDTVTNKEYALVGLYCSTAFVDITDPQNPVLVGTLPDRTELDGTRECTDAATAPKPENGFIANKFSKHDEAGKREGAVWRDIKVENDTAYIVSDHFEADESDPDAGTGAGLQVFDLTQLRSLAPADFPVAFDKTYSNAIGTFNAHNVFTYTNTTAGNSFAVVVGAEKGTNVCPGENAGGPLFFNIDTSVPQFVGRYCDDGYTHDIECVIYTGPDASHANKEICLASNEDTLTIFDASNKTAFDLLSRTTYNLALYTHQGSLDAAQKYFYQNDELDEKNIGLPTRSLVWDVSDLDSPELVTEYLAPVNASDHNNYVHGDYLYQSNYTSGLRILDIHSREAPYQKAFFDTFPDNNAAVFSGTWSNYLFPSGTVAASDIDRGLFLLQPTFSDATTADLAVTVTASESDVVIQTPYTYTLSVENQGPTAATEVFLTLRLSLGGTFSSTSTSDNDCVTVNQKLMQCRVSDSIASGASVDYSVDAAGFSDNAITAIAMASAKQLDAQGTDNIDTARVKLRPPSAPGGSGGGAISLWFLAGLLGLALVARRKQR